MWTIGLAAMVFAVFALLASGYAAWVAYQEKGKRGAIVAGVLTFGAMILLGWALVRFIRHLDA